MRRHTNPRAGHALSRLALASALALGAVPASAAVIVNGPFGTNPGGLVLGPGDTDLGTGQVFVGGNADAHLQVDAGSQLSAGALAFGTLTGFRGTGLFDGAGTVVNLTGAANRLDVGSSSMGSLIVSNGATLNGRANAAACAGLFCGTFIGNAAGSDGTFTVTGVGSNASFLSGFIVAGAAVFGPPTDTFTFGTPGGVTRGAVNVLAGGTLVTEGGTLGAGPGGSQPLGTERTFASVAIDGGGSVWQVTGGTLSPTSAFVGMATHRNASATLNITNGGSMVIQGPSTQINSIAIGQFGVAETVVSGPGSNMNFVGDNSGVINIGRNTGAVGSLAVRNGGQVSGVWYAAVGRDGGTGSLVVDGAGSLYRADGNTQLAAAGGAGSFVAALDIGRNGSTGRATVSNGGRIEIVATTARSNGPNILVGRDAGSTGTLTITGADSTVLLSAASTLPGGGAAEARNPLLRVGSLGTGVMNITNGGALVMQGNAVSTVAASRSTALFVGGTGDTASGGTGVALVSGAGSHITMTGSDGFIGVGIGAGASGTLTVASQASVNSMIINVGRSGGVGVMNLDNATVNLAGQQTGNNLAGAGMSVGSGGGTGIFSLSNGAVLNIDNAAGTVSAGLNLGGSANFAGGQGIMTMSGGSRIDITAPAGLGGITVGRSGVGTLHMSASSIDTHGNGGVVVGRDAGSVGTLVLADGSTLNTDFVGVGRNRDAAGVTGPGGIGTLVVNSGSTVTANLIEIGTSGYLGGNGTLVGNVVNYGVVNPGNSPGTLVIDGGFANLGRIVLEVEADGAGGFVTDHLVFTQGSTVNLGDADIVFSFLGSTDPNAFQAAGGFDVDNFIVQQAAGGGTVALEASVFADVTFKAEAESYVITSFVYTPDSGATFTATPVPEPATWASLAAGLALLAGLRRRRG